MINRNATKDRSLTSCPSFSPRWPMCWTSLVCRASRMSSSHTRMCTSGVRKGFQPVFANTSNVLCICDPDSMKMDELSDAQLDKLFFGVPLDEDELLRLIKETGRNLLFRGETMKTAKPKRAGLRGMSRASPVSYKR